MNEKMYIIIKGLRINLSVIKLLSRKLLSQNKYTYLLIKERNLSNYFGGYSIYE